MFFLHYNTILLQEQVFSFLSTKSFGYLWDLWVIYEHLCSNLQFISLPEEVGEFLLSFVKGQDYETVETSLPSFVIDILHCHNESEKTLFIDYLNFYDKLRKK